MFWARYARQVVAEKLLNYKLERATVNPCPFSLSTVNSAYPYPQSPIFCTKVHILPCLLHAILACPPSELTLAPALCSSGLMLCMIEKSIA